MAIRFGTAGNDTLNGTQDNDSFFAGAGDDTMFGGFGNDTFFASAGTDYMFGGSGSDTADYSNISEQPRTWYGINGAYVDLTNGNGGQVGDSGLDYYSSIENVTGSAFDDAIIGDGNVNVISGLAGNDIIEGGGGGDRLSGGTGVNSLMYTTSNARVSVDLQANTASGGHATGDIISGFQNLVGSAFSDSLLGSSAANIMSGGDGNDTINARSGNDTIDGGRGNDLLTGGAGSDTFVFYTGENTGTDHITDFDVDRDIIRIDAQQYTEAYFNISAGNYNPYAFTYDVIISIGDDHGQSGTVVLDDIFVGDIGQIMGQIELM